MDIGHRTSDIGHRTSDIGPRTSDLGPRMSGILRSPKSEVRRPKSDVRRPKSDVQMFAPSHARTMAREAKAHDTVGVYSACLFCHRDLGANEELSTLSIGKRIAFDSEKGRL